MERAVFKSFSEARAKPQELTFGNDELMNQYLGLDVRKQRLVEFVSRDDLMPPVYATSVAPPGTPAKDQPTRSWPDWAREMFFLKHKKNNDRYRLFLFLVVNGLPPRSARLYVLMQDTDEKGEPVFGTYDHTAQQQLIDLERKAESGELYEQNHYRLQRLTDGIVVEFPYLHHPAAKPALRKLY